jgi:hypothetical protein
MSLERPKLLLVLLICLFSFKTVGSDILFSINKNSSVNFYDKNNKSLFKFKKYKSGFNISFVEDNKRKLITVFNNGFEFRKKTYVIEDKNYRLINLVEINKLNEEESIYKNTIFINGLAYSKKIVTNLNQPSKSSNKINPLDFLGHSDYLEEVDFQAGRCLQKYNLDSDVIDWADEVMSNLVTIPFNYNDYLEFNGCRDRSICRKSECVINKTDFCESGDNDAFETMIVGAMSEGIGCLKSVNPSLGKLLIASLYDQKVNKNKRYKINCSSSNYQVPVKGLQGFATTPCHDQFPNLSVLTPGCYDGGSKISGRNFKRNVFHELMHTLGYVHGVAPDIPYGCGKLCFPSLNPAYSSDQMVKLKNICQESEEASDYYGGVITTFNKANDNVLLFSHKPDWALEDYRWRVNDVNENREDYITRFPQLSDYQGDDFTTLGVGLSLISKHSIALSSLLFIPNNDETKSQLNVTKNLSKMFLKFSDSDVQKIEELSEIYNTDKKEYIVKINSFVDSLMDTVTEGMEADEKSRIEGDLTTFKALSMKKTCIDLFDNEINLVSDSAAVDVCNKSPIGIDLSY